MGKLGARSCRAARLAIAGNGELATVVLALSSRYRAVVIDLLTISRGAERGAGLAPWGWGAPAVGAGLDFDAFHWRDAHGDDAAGDFCRSCLYVRCFWARAMRATTGLGVADGADGMRTYTLGGCIAQ